MSAIWIDEDFTPDRAQAVDAWELIEELKAISRPTTLVEFTYGDLGKDSANVESERGGLDGAGGGPPEPPADTASG